MQETADNSNRIKNSLPKDTRGKQENIKIHGIGLDKAGRCTHYHTQLDIAALLYVTVEMLAIEVAAHYGLSITTNGKSGFCCCTVCATLLCTCRCQTGN